MKTKLLFFMALALYSITIGLAWYSSKDNVEEVAHAQYPNGCYVEPMFRLAF